MSIGRDGIAGLILLAISLVLLVKSFQLPSLPIVPVGPGFYPAIVLSFMAAASALLVLQDLMKRRPAAQPARVTRRGEIIAWCDRIRDRRRSAYAGAAASGISRRHGPVRRRAAGLHWAGRERRGNGVLAAIALGTAVVSYFVFERYLLVLLPRGADGF